MNTDWQKQLKIIDELNKLTNKLYSIDQQIENFLQNSALEKAEFLVEQRDKLINIIQHLFAKLEENTLPHSATELLTTIRQKITIIHNNNSYLITLFTEAQQKVDQERSKLKNSRKKLQGYCHN